MKRIKLNFEVCVRGIIMQFLMPICWGFICGDCERSAHLLGVNFDDFWRNWYGKHKSNHY